MQVRDRRRAHPPARAVEPNAHVRHISCDIDRYFGLIRRLSSAATAQPGQASPNAALAGAVGANGQTSMTLSQLAQLKPTGPVDGPVLGGLLSGVGSKVDQPSIKFYKGGKKYNQWEFIWNPLEDQAQALQQGLSTPPKATVPGQPGQSIGVGAAGTSILGTPPSRAQPVRRRRRPWCTSTGPDGQTSPTDTSPGP